MFMDQIFDVKINIMDNVDLDIINSIEEKCFKGKGLSQNELDYYLNYVVYQTREILALNKNISTGKFDDEEKEIMVDPLEDLKQYRDAILAHFQQLSEFIRKE